MQLFYGWVWAPGDTEISEFGFVRAAIQFFSFPVSPKPPRWLPLHPPE